MSLLLLLRPHGEAAPSVVEELSPGSVSPWGKPAVLERIDVTLALPGAGFVLGSNSPMVSLDHSARFKLEEDIIAQLP